MPYLHSAWLGRWAGRDGGSISRVTALFIALAVCWGGMMMPVWAGLRVRDVTIDLIPLPAGETYHGYREYRVLLHNEGGGAADVHLWIKGVNSGNQHAISRIERRLRLAAGDRVQVSLWQPPLPMSSHALSVSVNRSAVEEIILPAGSGHVAAWSFSSAKPCILLSRAISSDDFENMVNEHAYVIIPTPTNTTTKTYTTASFELIRSEVASSQWADDWLGYSAFDAVVLSGQECRDLPASVIAALRAYAECGGAVIQLGGEAPGGRVFPLRGTPEGVSGVRLGFGLWLVCEGTAPDALNAAAYRYFRNCWDEARMPWNPLEDENEAHGKFPVIDGLSTPVRGFLLLMLLFAFIIGPLNVFLTYRAKRPIWLLWTIPACSLVACLLVFVYSLVREGVTPTVRLDGITLLDQADHRAVTLGREGYYAPLTPGGGLHFDYGVELTPLVNRRYNTAGLSRLLDWSVDQHLDAGWISARVPAYFMVRNHTLRRERLIVTRDETGMPIAVLNGLGADIKELWLADSTGALYNAEAIPAGAVGKIKPWLSSEGIKDDGASDWRDIYRKGDWFGIGAFAPGNVTRRLVPDSYMVILDGAPFMRNGLDQSAHINARSTVIGLLEAHTP